MSTIAGITGWLLLVVGILVIQPIIIYCLWDDVMVKFFQLQDVTFYESIWISVLSSVLFKSTSSNDSK